MSDNDANEATDKCTIQDTESDYEPVILTECNDETDGPKEVTEESTEDGEYYNPEHIYGSTLYEGMEGINLKDIIMVVAIAAGLFVLTKDV
jgi:hypothetical protein